MLDARLCFFKNGLKSSGTNQYPMNKKLMPKFLVFLSNPVVFQLMALYMTADEKAISTDLILMSPSVNIFSYLNLVIWLAHFTSMSLQRVHYYFHSWRHYSFDSKKVTLFSQQNRLGQVHFYPSSFPRYTSSPKARTPSLSISAETGSLENSPFKTSLRHFPCFFFCVVAIIYC